MTRENRKKRNFSFWLIFCAIVFVTGIIYGIVDLKTSEMTYDQLEYREYVFVSYEIYDVPRGADVFYIKVEGEDKTLYVDQLLTSHKHDDFEALTSGDKLYCYVYERDGKIKIAEIKADEMIISLQEHNDRHRENGIGLIVMMSVLIIVCIVFVILSNRPKKTKRKGYVTRNG